MTHDQENDRNEAWLRRLLDGLTASNSSAEEMAQRLYLHAHSGTVARRPDPRIAFCYEATSILFVIKNWRDEVGRDAMPANINDLLDGVYERALRVTSHLTAA